MVCRDCLGRTPFGSLIATVVMFAGVGLFCGTLYRAAQITLQNIFRDLFGLEIQWLYTLHIAFIIVAVVMAAFSLLLLVFGCLATGATRQNVYSGAKCIMGGRLSAGFFLLVAYLLNACWMVLTSACALPIILCVMLRAVCLVEVSDQFSHWAYERGCLNLSRFGIYVNATATVKNGLCDYTEKSALCQQVEDATPMFSLAFVGSLIVVLAMVQFLLTLAANYTSIKTSKEMGEYREAIRLDENATYT